MEPSCPWDGVRCPSGTSLSLETIEGPTAVFPTRVHLANGCLGWGQHWFLSAWPGPQLGPHPRRTSPAEKRRCDCSHRTPPQRATPQMSLSAEHRCPEADCLRVQHLSGQAVGLGSDALSPTGLDSPSPILGRACLWVQGTQNAEEMDGRVPVMGRAQGGLSPGSKRPLGGYLTLWAKVRLTSQSHVRRTYQSQLGEDLAIGQLTKESHCRGPDR